MPKLFVFAFFLIFVSCSERTTISDTGTIVVDYNEENIFKWDNFVQVLSVIPLETNTDCLLSYARKCLFMDDYIVFHDDKQKAIYVFNENGFFLYSIDAVGSGPNEYTEIRDVIISYDKKSILVLDNASVLAFDAKSGMFQNRFSLDPIVASDFYRFANTEERVYYFWSTEKINSLYLYKDDRLEAIQKNEGFPYVCQKFYNGPKGSLNYISNYGTFTISTLKGSDAVNEHIFDFGRWNLPSEMLPKDVGELEVVDKREYFKCIMSAFETDDFLYATTVSPDKKLYNICVDKQTHKVKTGCQDEDAPIVVVGTHNNSFYGIIYPYYFSKESHFRNLMNAYNCNEESNPLLIKFIFKSSDEYPMLDAAMSYYLYKIEKR